jgi:hypothetical protein
VTRRRFLAVSAAVVGVAAGLVLFVGWVGSHVDLDDSPPVNG